MHIDKYTTMSRIQREKCVTKYGRISQKHWMEDGPGNTRSDSADPDKGAGPGIESGE